MWRRLHIKRQTTPPSVIIGLIAVGLLPIAINRPGSKGECQSVSAQTFPDAAAEQAVRIGVFGLFHPHELTVRAALGQALALRAGEESIVLERSSGTDSASIDVSGSNILISAGSRVARASAVMISGRRNEPKEFVLAVPGKIKRTYRGTLRITAHSGSLVAVVSMDRESVVASVVAAEAVQDTPLEALKAQAIAARSYIVASRNRHLDYDFCDTTHCQFLRELPPAESTVAKAVAATHDLVLAYDSQPFAAMYTRSCGGHTHTPAELDLASARYPYYSVQCRYCLTHTICWTSSLSAQKLPHCVSSTNQHVLS